MTLSVHLVTRKESGLPSLIKDACDSEQWKFSMSRDNLPDHQHIDFKEFDVVSFDTSGNFDNVLNCYKALLSTGSLGCPAVFVSQRYQHHEVEELAGYPDAYYLVQPTEQEQLISYLRKFSRSREHILGKFSALLHGELGLLLDKTSIISITDNRGRIVYANERFCEVSGYNQKELIGENHRILKSGVHDPEIYQNMWRTITQGNIWQGKVCNKKKDGGYYWVKSEIHPICDTNGRPILFFSIRSEVTQEVELTNQLAINEERVRLSNAFANIVSFEWDFNTNQVHVSDEIQNLYGLKQPTNLLEHSRVVEMIHPDDRQEAVDMIEACKTNNHEYKVEHRIIGEDGVIRWVSKRGKIIYGDNGEPERMLGVVADIQEIKEAQDREQKANQVKTAFLTSLAHEVRNPLNAISGYAQLIKKKPDIESSVERANRIIEISKYMIELLGEVDDLSKLEAGKVELNIESISLESMLQECRQVVSPLLGEIRLFQDETDLSVRADKRQLKQVIINLLSNAIKYNKEMGRIFVSAKHRENGMVRLEVEDTGMGIAEDQIDKIFIPFERLDWEKSEVQGLGLGLPLSKMLIEKMGGSTGVESQVGLGTRIWIELPISEAQELPESPIEREEAPQTIDDYHFTKGTRVLLVEDNEFNQHFMTEQLSLYGFEITHASNGIEALAKLNERSFDLILTDCNMPKMDGFELARRIRASESGSLKDIPIVAITARSSKRSHQECMEAGISDILIKPIMADDLLEKIQSILNQQQPDNAAAESSQEETPCNVVELQATSKLIDHSILNGYIGDDKKAQTKLLKIFQNLYKTSAKELYTAFEKQDYKALHFIAHKLASSSLSIGASAISSSLRHIENDINQEHYDDIHSYIDHLKHLQPLLEHELEVLINDAPEQQTETDPAGDLSKVSELNVLIIDDDEFSINHARHQLHKIGLQHIESAESVIEALDLIIQRPNSFDILFCDINMPDTDGLEFIRLLSSNYRNEGLVIYSSEKALIKSVKNLIGSYNMKLLGHLEKPFKKSELLEIIREQLKQPEKGSKQYQDPLTDKEIRDGIKQNALEVVYQPQVSTNDQTIIGVEALARFRRRSGSLVGPAQFIPQIERMGLEYPFSIVIFEKAVSQLASWMSQGIDITMSVNFSMVAIENLELPEMLANICSQKGISTDCIVVEVTESEITSNPQVALEVLGRMRLQGFNLSIDDFGTGYSSLEKLQMLPFSELKLDRSYVSTACQEQVSMAIMKSSIELAKQLNLKTVAEGVENTDDMALSREIGVDVIQGYHIARPMPAAELTEWINNFPNQQLTGSL